jgi:3-hydroxyisobutyrate dehydrogenase-like beta-hydroxyacid dehydrogenase
MALNVLAADYEVVAHTRTRAVLDEVVDRGAAHRRARGGATSTDFVVTMLPDGEAVRDVVFGDTGVLKRARPGSRLIDKEHSPTPGPPAG